jgi:DNA polymerase I-like protein with 3'-5' exonuclease and polymerase domains
MTVNPRTYEAYQLFHDGILALAKAEQQGIRVDVEYIQNKKSHLTRKIERLEKQFEETVFYKKWSDTQKGTVNIYSPTQLANYLYKTKRIKILKETASGQGSTDEETLKQLNMPELDSLLEIRKLRKVRDTYLDSYLREQVNGVIHPFYNLHLVKSFRSSSDSPNLQNVPKRDEETMQMVRGALYPRQNHQLLEIDFKALEVVISCCYNRDRNLIKYIKDPKTDMHADMAKQIFMLDKFDKEKHNILRQAAKNGFVFPEFYGDYFINCAENMACGWGKLGKGRWKEGEGIEFDNTFLSDHLISKGITTLKKFEKHVEKIEEDFWGNRFADYATWKDRWYKTYRKYGYIDLLTGFRCSGVMTKNEVINLPVQGSAFHCLLWSFIEMTNYIDKYKLDSRLIGQVHDSMLFDILPDELPLILKKVYEVTTIDLLRAWDWIIVPLAIEAELAPVNASWADKEKIDIF